MAKIGILLPAYNEERNIRIVIKEARKYILNSTIVVIDDGSTDKTSKLAKKSKVIVLRHATNKGKGEALKTGFKYFLEKENINYIIIADTDRQYEIKDATLLLRPLRNKSADLVMGFRDWRSVPFRHRLGNIVWRSAFNILFGTNLKDTNCGLMSMNKNAANILKDALHGGYIIENAILSLAVKKGLKIKQVPVKVDYKKKSNVKRGIRIVSGVLFFIVKEGLRYRLGRK